MAMMARHPPQQATLPVKVVKKDRFSTVKRVDREKAIAVLGTTNVNDEDIEQLNSERKALLLAIKDRLKSIYVLNCSLRTFPTHVTPRSFAEFGKLYSTCQNFDHDNPISSSFDYVMKGGFVERSRVEDGRIIPYDEVIEREIMIELSLTYEASNNPLRRGFIRKMVNHSKGELDGLLNKRRMKNAKSDDGVVTVIRRRNDNGSAVTTEERKEAAKRKAM
jgi:hypothetical protein